MISLKKAKELQHGTILYHVTFRNADGTPQRWRVNGKVKTWKRSPERIEIPIKHGLRSFDYLTENELELVSLSEKEAMKGAR